MSNLTILNTSIRKLDDLYSLTDLHRISGGEAKHKPVLFLSNQQTKDLISEIENDKVGISTLALKTVRGGRNPSTYACEELALAYATWISPKFHLVVLRAFIAMHKGELQNSTQITPLAEPKPDIVLSYDDAYWIAKYLVRAKAFGKEVEAFHRKMYEDLGIPRYIKNEIAAKGYDLAHEFSHKLDPFIEQIFPQVANVKRIVNC
ncbi:KilA-N domain-containing protein [Glaesserella parasuis]|uniref:KilA-N domain-containing protein n=1 Tax=Glaesserella parasuis TaxID=738 RepID=UPI0024372CF7|nr:KilA-N domain-containing protein [Glaesserella parasuis]MDG6350670.1 KilA-N domain-containing protein [Glaesserella parasuis]MDG6474317.1 KilA-N domain-containing protein [Glaesserella parasuis]MDO9799814.1 KilA-N domain-containing protein [Glaesserella parasuis]MDO9851818.1 KilA-N domain-containing protein [Glaesserella parasuis]MDO9865213.1 KilA-N domain-containing protein [Glaesserella parasuis]